MKRSAFLFAFIFCLLSLFSCTKETKYSSGSGPTSFYSNPVYLVATIWEQPAPNVFTSNLHNVVSFSPGRVIQVYARIDKDDVLISSGGTAYKNGYLSASIDGTDINLTFRYFGANGAMPFSSLDLKLVYQ